MRSALLVLLLFLLAVPLSAQAFEETFPFPNGNIIPGWTAQSGTWSINNGRITSPGSWAYITYDKFKIKDCVLDVDCHMVGSGLQFAGVTSRHPGGSSTTNLVMAKIQNNNSGPRWDRVFIYEQGGSGSVYVDVPGNSQVARVRLITLGANAWMMVDADMDGIFELEAPVRTLSKVLSAGLVGLNCYRSAEMDNFKFYDAVLMEKTGSPAPAPGAKYQMHFHALPFNPKVPNPYLCAASLSSKPTPIGDGRKIPLQPDLLFALTLQAPAIFSGFNGVLDLNGDATLTFNIPNDPVLKGLGIYVAGFSIDPNKFLSIGAISNDHYIKIQ